MAKQLVTRQEVSAIFGRLLRGELSPAEEAGLVARLKMGREVAIPFLLERLQRGLGVESNLAAYLLPAVGGRRARELLRQVMSDPGVTDQARATAMAALGDLGEPVDGASFLAQMRDPQKLSMELMEEMLSLITTNEAALEALIWQFQRTPSRQRSEMIRALGSMGDSRILRLLLPLLYAREVSTILAAIEALELLGAAEAVPALTELSLGSPRPEVRERSRAAYGKLAVQAVSTTLPGKQGATLGTSLPLFKAMVTTIDGDGGQCILVGRRRPDRRLKVIGVFFNDHQGIKDCFGDDLVTVKEWRGLVSELQRGDIGWVEIDLPQCRRMLSQARALNTRLRRKLPMALEVWRPLLEDGPGAARLFPEEQIEEMGALQQMAMEPEKLKHTAELLYLGEFNSWRFALQDMGPNVLPILEGLRRSRATQQQKSQTVESFIADMVERLLKKPRLRVLLQERLRRQGWLLAKLGRQDHSQLALVAAAAMAKDSGIAIRDHPFLRAMAVRSLVGVMATMGENLGKLAAAAGPEPAPNKGREAKGTLVKTYCLKVSLKDRPGVWRMIEIRGNQSLHRLHQAIFSAFDRYDEHLYAFYLSNKPWDENSEYHAPNAAEGTGRDASRTRIDGLGLRVGRKFLYLFDFGDEWWHSIEVVGVKEAAAGKKYPMVVERRGKSPPQYPETDE